MSYKPVVSMSKETRELREKAEAAKFFLKIGKISLEEAKRQAQPFIDHVNAGARRIAKEYGGTPRFVNVSSFLR